MKKSVALLLALLCLALSACGGEPAPVSVETPPAEPVSSEAPAVVPPYSFINSEKYVSGGKEGRAYRVEISESASEEDMRAVFADLTSADDYPLHTVWFYGQAGDVDAIGSYTVGMLEETAPGSVPVFTACTLDAATIAAFRDKAVEEAAAAELVKSIPAPSIMQEALVPENSFNPAPAVIFSTTAEENGLAGSAYYAEGEVVSRSEAGGYDTIRLSTADGDLYISAVSVPFGEIAEGDSATVFFVYAGWSNSLEAPAAEYVYLE